MNLETLETPIQKAVVYPDTQPTVRSWSSLRPVHSTWLGNKVVYRTCMAPAVKALDIVAEKKAAKASRPSLQLAYLSKDGGEGIMNSGSNTALRRARKRGQLDKPFLFQSGGARKR